MFQTDSIMYAPGLFAGKTALVTGGATGIGLAITKQLFSLGANVVIASRRVENLKNAQNEVKSEFSKIQSEFKNEITYLELNQRDLKQTEGVVNQVISDFDKLDFLVANGGGQYFSPLEKITPKGWHAVVDTNLNGTECYKM